MSWFSQKRDTFHKCGLCDGLFRSAQTCYAEGGVQSCLRCEPVLSARFKGRQHQETFSRSQSPSPTTTDRVCAQLQERHKSGLAKYGVTVDRTDIDEDGWLQHLKEELMDAVIYLDRMQAERKKAKKHLAE